MKMKFKLLVIGLFALVLVLGGLLVGSKYGASTSWTNEVASQANIDLGKAGYAKKEEILARDITADMADVLDPKIAEEQAILESLLDEYYQMKIDGLVGTADYAALEVEIERIRNSILARYQVEIDAMFEGQ